MAEGLLAELFEALREGDPQAYHSSGMLNSGKGWVLTSDTVREVAQQTGNPLPDDYDWSATDGVLLGLPYRVDDTVDRFKLETIQ